jgi:hypothetical protein
MTLHHSPRGKLIPAPTDPETLRLRANVVNALQPPMYPKDADRCNQELADHIRNQNRVRRGLEPIVARWNHAVPETRIVLEQAA